MFLFIFSFLLGLSQVEEMPILIIAYDKLMTPPESIENVSNIPFLNAPIYFGYLIYYGILKVIQFLGLIMVFLIYANTLQLGIPVPIISVVMSIASIFIIFEIVKMFRGTP